MDIFRKNKLEEKLIRALNNLNLNRKLLLLYLLCVLLPLLITDGFILTSIISNERSQFNEEMKTVAKNVSADFINSIKTASDVSNNMYVDRSIYTFLDTPFNDNEDFYTRYYEWIRQNGYQSLYLPHLARFIFVADNNTIVPGGNIYTLKSVEDNNWYQEFISSKYKAQFIFYFMGDESDAIQTKTKQVKLVRWLDYYKDTEIKKLLVINLDYPSLMSNLSSKNYGMLAYICDGEKIIFSTDGQMNIYSPYTSINDADRRKVGYTSEVSFMGKTYTVMVFPDNSNVVAGAFRKNLPVVILLLAMNILMPLVLVRLINKSFISRLGKLNKVFEIGTDNVGLVTVNDVEGSDETGYTAYFDDGRVAYGLMPVFDEHCYWVGYNSESVENIRMHSVIKGEKETASMIERLAALERDVVEWNQDVIPLYKEMTFIKNYLKLQQYRYGERFSFSINVSDEVSDASIPKLTLATFVENACVHGAEKKTRDVVIIINAHASGDKLILEIEDTGAGMDSASAERLQKRMRECTFADLKKNKHIGILNACLRTKLIAGGDVDFLFESEEQIGTYIKITMPLKHYELQQAEGGEE